MKLCGVHHVSLNVDDAEKCGRFYRDVLGLEVLPRPAFPIAGFWFRVSPQQEIHLIEVKQHSVAKGQHFAFGVDDIEAASAELASHGVELGKIYELPNGARQTFFFDPAGNMIELNQQPREIR